MSNWFVSVIKKDLVFWLKNHNLVLGGTSTFFSIFSLNIFSLCAYHLQDFFDLFCSKEVLDYVGVLVLTESERENTMFLLLWLVFNAILIFSLLYVFTGGEMIC